CGRLGGGVDEQSAEPHAEQRFPPPTRGGTGWGVDDRSEGGSMTDRTPSLRAIYRRLVRRFGPAGWWPGETPFEVCLGAILVQNTSWTNVERALERLRRAGRLSFAGLSPLSVSRIASLIRPSGTFRVKASRVRAFLDFLGSAYRGRVEAMRAEDPWVLRGRLLGVHGIGPETADSIALYAAGQPLFVVDAYTRRIFTRLGLLGR